MNELRLKNNSNNEHFKEEKEIKIEEGKILSKL